MIAEVDALSGGCIILLDVPPGSAITLDGVTRVTSPFSASAAATPPAPFHRGLWIINNLRSNSCEDFHLLIVRSGARKYRSTDGGGHTLPVGFALLTPSREATPTAAELGYNWIFARRYDPYTEEISNTPADELSLKNIVMAMEDGGELARHVIPYDQFMGTVSASGLNESNSVKTYVPSWETRTSLINARYLQRCHAISHVTKIVPSCDISDQNDFMEHGATSSNNLEHDGTPVSYPPIPCIDRTINARKLVQHPGTRIYLSKLSPGKRTWLLFGGDSDTELSNQGGFVWRDVLCRYYGGDTAGSSERENDFLADVEFSFLLFLFLECHASLEHWRDAISMCSCSAASEKNNMVIQRPRFFHKLLSILCSQMSCIETDFFEQVEYSSGENNFMVGALRRLCNACEGLGKRKRDSDIIAESLKSTSQKLRELVRDRFGVDLSLPKSEDDMGCDMLDPTVDDDNVASHGKIDTYELHKNQSEDNDDEDGPVIVPYDQIEASLTRSSLQSVQISKRRHGQISPEIAEEQIRRKEYPLLYASMASEEDEVMACARILDESKDASLVREAAAYLQQVEVHRGIFSTLGAQQNEGVEVGTTQTHLLY